MWHLKSLYLWNEIQMSIFKCVNDCFTGKAVGTLPAIIIIFIVLYITILYITLFRDFLCHTSFKPHSNPVKFPVSLFHWRNEGFRKISRLPQFTTQKISSMSQVWLTPKPRWLVTKQSTSPLNVLMIFNLLKLQSCLTFSKHMIQGFKKTIFIKQSYWFWVSQFKWSITNKWFLIFWYIVSKP